MKKRLFSIILLVLIFPSILFLTSCELTEEPGKINISSSVKFVVKFDSDGGTAVDSIKVYSSQSTIKQPTSPSKTGYNFEGWYNGDKIWNFETDIVTSNLTLKAKWSLVSTFTVTFMVDESTYSSISEIENGSTINAPETPTKNGYKFVGWYNGDIIWNFETDTVTSNLTLKAIWSHIHTYSVTFMIDDSTYTSLSEIETGSMINAPTEPIREGYKFVGWYNGDKIWNFNTDVVNNNITLKAKWIEIFTVTFEDETHYIYTSLTNVIKDSRIDEPDRPTKVGYIFIGWFNGDMLWNFETNNVTSNLILTAKWNKSDEFTNINSGNNIGSEETPYIIYDLETFKLIEEFGGKTKPVRVKVQENKSIPEFNGDEIIYIEKLVDKLDENGNVVYLDTDETEVYHFRFEADIDFSGKTFIPMFKNEPFIGKIDGNGKVVKNINISITKDNLLDYIYLNSEEEYSARIAMFGYTYGAIIENITFENIYINVNEDVIQFIKSDTSNSFYNTYNGILKDFVVSSLIAVAKDTTLKANVSANINSDIYTITADNHINGTNAIGGVIALAKDCTITSASETENAIIDVKIVADDGNKGYYIGGVAGYLYDSKVSKLNVKADIKATSDVKNTMISDNVIYIGGMIGFMRNSSIEDSTVNLVVKQTEENHIDMEELKENEPDIYNNMNDYFNKIGGVVAIIRANNNEQTSNITRVKVTSNVEMDGMFGGLVYETRSTRIFLSTHDVEIKNDDDGKGNYYTNSGANEKVYVIVDEDGFIIKDGNKIIKNANTFTSEDKNTIYVTFEDIITESKVKVIKVYGIAGNLLFTEIKYSTEFEYGKYEYTDSEGEKYKFDYNIKITGSTLLKTNDNDFTVPANNRIVAAYIVCSNAAYKIIHFEKEKIKTIHSRNITFGSYNYDGINLKSNANQI